MHLFVIIINLDNVNLTIAYTSGVAEPCLEINKNYENIYDYTSKGNLVVAYNKWYSSIRLR